MSAPEPQPTIEGVLAQIARQLDLSSQTEHELLEEIRGHLEDAVEAAIHQGQEPRLALQAVAERFGVELTAAALQAEHAPWESADAIVACILPVGGALLLRWLAFVPAGTAANWSHLLLQPVFWSVAFFILLTSFLYYRRWQLALTVWSFFWALSLIILLLGTPAP
ncbi:MAG: hypothetical protein KDE04_15310 [Anaerolineales bacterium]|nr:hypothetical protein [Anaerolineales bacterium]MCB0031737.1 hypothetical protein [Anaerolineales bacterium]